MGKLTAGANNDTQTAALVADIKKQPWYQKNKAGFDRAIDATLKIPGNDEHKAALIYALADASVKAAHYSRDADPTVAKRAKMKSARDGKAKLAEATHTLALAAQRNDPVFRWAFRIAAGKTGFTGGAAREFFTELEKALSGRLPEIDGGPFVHRTVIGNLGFQKPIEPARAGDVGAITMLAFELVFWLRVHSNGWNWSWQLGAPMPATGHPRYAVAALWIEAALGVPMAAIDVQDRVRKLPAGTVLMEWPADQ